MNWNPNFLSPGPYGLDSAGEVVRLLIVILALTFFVHISAKMVLDKSNLYEALASVVLGILAYYLVWHIISVPVIALILGLVAFAFIIGLVYRTKKWGKGAAVGGVACVLWYLSGVVLNWILSAVTN